MKVRIWLNAVDVTSRLQETGWNIDHRSGGAISTAKFLLHDPNLDLHPQRGQEVIIENYDDNTDRFFGGVLVDSADTEDSGLGLDWQCSALGWMFILDRALVTGTWRGRSDKEIINGTNPAGSDNGIFKISDTDLSDFDASTLVSTGIVNTQFMQVQGQTVRDVMDKLAATSGFVWGVTPLKKIYYRSPGAAAMTFALSDSPDGIASFHYTGYSRFYDFTKIVNAVQIEGAYTRQLAQTQNYAGDGVTTMFGGLDLWQAGSGLTRITVELNTGSDAVPAWTAQAVGLAGSLNDEANLGGTINVLWDPAIRTLRWATAPGNLTAAFRIKGDILRRIIHVEVLEDSILALGRRYSITIRDETITSEDEAEARASAELQKLSIEAERHTLRTTKSGILPGSSILLANARRYELVNGVWQQGIESFYLVERVEMHLLGGTLFEYEVTLRFKVEVSSFPR